LTERRREDPGLVSLGAEIAVSEVSWRAGMTLWPESFVRLVWLPSLLEVSSLGRMSTGVVAVFVVPESRARTLECIMRIEVLSWRSEVYGSCGMKLSMEDMGERAIAEVFLEGEGISGVWRGLTLAFCLRLTRGERLEGECERLGVSCA
jgi:hypothetical protein